MSTQTQEKRVRFYELLEKSLILTYGKWGAVYREHLLKTNPEKYYILLSDGNLYEHISKIDTRMYNKYNELVRALSEKAGLTKELKKKEPEKWNRKLKSVEKQAAETIKEEIRSLLHTV